VPNIGSKLWAVAEGYIPPGSTGPYPEFLSHEALCILNATDTDTEIRITVYFSSREPAGPYVFRLSARRTLHTRFNDMHAPESIPIGLGFSSTIEADVPIVVQHTRLDSRQAANALMTTIAYASPTAG